MRLLRDPALFLFLLVFVTPLLFVEAIYESATLPRRSWIQFLTLLLWGLTCIRSESIRFLPKLLFSSALILVTFGVSASFAIDVSTAWLRFMDWLTALLLCYLIASTCDSRKTLWMLWGASVSATCVSMIGMAQVCVGFDYYPQSIAPASTFFNKNFAAEYLVTVLPASFFLIFRSTSRVRFFQSVAFLIQLSYLLMTRSRASWLGFFVATLFFLWLFRRSKNEWTISSWGKRVTLLFVLGFSMIFLWNASSLIKDIGRTETIRQRFTLWANALAILQDHFWWGIGPGNFRVVYPFYHQRVLVDTTFTLAQQPHEIHQDLLQILIECGFLGFLAFALFAGFLFQILRNFWVKTEEKSEKLMDCLSAFLGIIAFFINSCFSFPLKNPASAMMFWIWCGILFSYSPQFSWKKIKASLFWSLLILFALAGSLWFSFLSFLGHYHLKQAKLACYFQHAYDSLTHIFLADTYFPWDYEIWRERSILQSSFSSNWPKNIVVLESIRQKDPYYLNNLINLALAYRKTQQFERSRELYEFILQIRPEEFHSLLGMALLYREQNRLEEAIFWMKKAQQQSPQDSTVLRFLEMISKEKK